MNTTNSINTTFITQNYNDSDDINTSSDDDPIDLLNRLEKDTLEGIQFSMPRNIIENNLMNIDQNDMDDNEQLVEVTVNDSELDQDKQQLIGLNPYLLKRIQQKRMFNNMPNSNNVPKLNHQTNDSESSSNSYSMTNKRTFLDDNKKPDGIVGLTNLGNTCYMNSILQCLFNIEIFKDMFTDQDIIKELHKYVTKDIDEDNKNNVSVILAKSQLTITYQMHRLISAIWSNQSKHIRPINFKNIFQNKINSFQSYEHQDSQEALICILDTIHKELQKEVDIEYNFIKEKVEIGPNQYITYLDIIQTMEESKLSDIECCLQEKELPNIWELLSIKRALDINKKNYSLITKLFQTVLSSTLECPTCHFHSYNFSDMTNMLLIEIPQNLKIDNIDEEMEKFTNIPEHTRDQIKQKLIMKQLNNNTYTLEECFNNLMRVVKLSDSEKWHCVNCDTKVNALKKFNIWIPPNIMIIQIKRFGYKIDNENNFVGFKLCNLITFPIKEFNINPYMSDYSKKMGDFTYDLIAISNHIGNLNGGHYNSYVKSYSDDNWYCMDDDNVTLLNESNLITPNAYILFYKLRN